jgi:enamine deaminase RidA (YjgF/YER057c/UK114 family)
MSHEHIRVLNSGDGRLMPTMDFEVCQAVRAGRYIFLRGQTGLTLDNKTFVGKGDPTAQAENAMQSVKTLLEEAGALLEDVCKITTYVTEREYRALVYPVIARYLSDAHPVSTGLVVAGLATPDIDFEIDVFAVIPDERL